MEKLLVVAGLTACGKSALAVSLAERFNGEVISADSAQVYKGMDIGTAKITPDEMKGVPHHLIDIISPNEEWNVTKFQALANEAVRGVISRGKLPIICGGTGYYINSVLYGNEFVEEEPDLVYRESLYALAREAGNGCVHELLREVDPESAANIHENNLKRVIRALEYHKQRNSRISEHNSIERRRDMVYNSCILVLDMDRELLSRKISERVDKMIADGLADEVRGLLEAGCGRQSTAVQAIGYKELIAWIDGEISFDEAAEIIKRNTRRYAKRQRTWFKHQTDGHFIDVSGKSPDLVSREAAEYISQFYR